MTRSAALIARIRELSARCPASALAIASLELVEEYEIAVAQALAAEAAIHRLTKGTP